MFKCHTDMINYYLHIKLRKFFNNIISLHSLLFNSFVLNAPFLYPLKTSKNLTVFWCFQGVEKECIGNERVKEMFIDDSFIYLLTDWLYMLALRLKDQNLNPLWTDLICSKFWLSRQLHFFRDVQFVHQILHLHFHHSCV